MTIIPCDLRVESLGELGVTFVDQDLEIKGDLSLAQILTCIDGVGSTPI